MSERKKCAGCEIFHDPGDLHRGRCYDCQQMLLAAAKVEAKKLLRSETLREGVWIAPDAEYAAGRLCTVTVGHMIPNNAKTLAAYLIDAVEWKRLAERHLGLNPYGVGVLMVVLGLIEMGVLEEPKVPEPEEAAEEAD